MASYTEPATKEGLARLMDSVFSWAAGKGITPLLRQRIEFVAEEVLVNIVSHAFRENRGEMCIKCIMVGNSVHLTFMDDGPAFDPTRLAAPDVNLSLEKREVGGLGIFLVREMVDKISYCRKGSRNILDIKIEFPEKETQ